MSEAKGNTGNSSKSGPERPFSRHGLGRNERSINERPCLSSTEIVTLPGPVLRDCCYCATVQYVTMFCWTPHYAVIRYDINIATQLNDRHSHQRSPGRQSPARASLYSSGGSESGLDFGSCSRPHADHYVVLTDGLEGKSMSRPMAMDVLAGPGHDGTRPRPPPKSRDIRLSYPRFELYRIKCLA
jgi:hypothetical protein